MGVTGDGSKVRCYKKKYCIGAWNESKQIGSGQTGDGKSERQNFRNQWTKMDWNLTQMTTISTAVGKNPLEEMEEPS